MKSWRTTLSGALAAIGVLVAQLGFAVDSDPETVFDLSGFLEALGAIQTAVSLFFMGLKARDNKVSSEEAGAK